jgi:hypothetical protein
MVRIGTSAIAICSANINNAFLGACGNHFKAKNPMMGNWATMSS